MASNSGNPDWFAFIPAHIFLIIKKHKSWTIKKNNPIDSEGKVQQSKDEHIDQDYPGYPHYPAKEDIMNPQNHTERIEAGVENLTHDELQEKR